MSRYLLDTTALIDFSKQREPAFSFILGATKAGDQLGVCAINVAEFYAGLPSHSRVKWDKFVGSLHYWEITRSAAVRAGEYRYEFARQGQILFTTDALVAALARENQAVVVTGNVTDYPMNDVQLFPLTWCIGGYRHSEPPRSGSTDHRRQGTHRFESGLLDSVAPYSVSSTPENHSIVS